MKDFVLKMPVLEPLPIRTHGKNGWVRTYRWLFGKRTWILKEVFFYPVKGELVRIPAGFVTDFASIPRLFWPLLSPTGILMIPGLLHDWYYQHNYFEVQSKSFDIITKYFIGNGKRFADQVFRDIGKELNGMVVPNIIAYVALDIFGWPVWLKYRKNDN